MQNLFDDSIDGFDTKPSLGIISKLYPLIGFIIGTLVSWVFLVLFSAVIITILEVIIRTNITPSLLTLWLMASGGGIITALILWRVHESRFNYAIPIICLILSGIGMIFAGITVFWYTHPWKFPGNYLAENSKPHVAVDDPYPPYLIRSTVFSYLAQPAVAGSKVEKQILGNMHLEIIDLDTQHLYFTLPAPEDKISTKELDDAIAKLMTDPTKIDKAKKGDPFDGRLYLGKYTLWQSEERWFFFRTDISNVKIDPDAVLNFQYSQATYNISIKELTDFLTNRNVFGGPLYAVTDQEIKGGPMVFANHGTMVSKPGEKSLQRFVSELTKDISDEDSQAREKRVQRLLDFVSKEIAYDEGEAAYNIELLKRPNEVLMSGKSDCSNKTILLGSMLESIGEDYLFVYMPKHITVAVRKGNFSDNNKLSLLWENETWVIAETTAPGFQIGLDQLKEKTIFKQWKYVQRPRQSNKIFNFATGEELSFR
jgi:hypothetical protein